MAKDNRPARRRRRYDELTLKTVWALSAGRCEFQGCGKALFERVGGNWRNEAYLGHIYGLNEGSARFDPTKTAEELNAPDNLMPLCAVHHKEVDDKELQSEYPPKKLREWKKAHEEAVVSSKPDLPDFEPALDVWADGPGTIGRILREHAEEEIVSDGPGPVQRIVATDGAVGEIVERKARKILRRECASTRSQHRRGQLHIEGDAGSTGMALEGEVAIQGAADDPASLSLGRGGSIGFRQHGKLVFKGPRELRGKCPECSAEIVVRPPPPLVVRCKNCGRSWPTSLDKA